MALKIYDKMMPASDFKIADADKIDYTNTGYESILSAADALDILLRAYGQELGTSLSFDEVTSELGLVNQAGNQVGKTIKILTSGIEDISTEVVPEEDSEGNLVYYLILSDQEGNELSKCLLPATGGGGGGSYLIRLLSLNGSTKYSVASGQKHELTVLYMETLGTESTGVDGSLVVEYKLESETEYKPIGTYTISCATSKEDITKALSIDVTDYLTVGDVTNIRLTVTGGESDQTKTLNYTITTVEMGMTTTTGFDKVFTSNFAFLYRCLGRGLAKTVYFYIDDELYNSLDVGTSHNTQLSQTIELLNNFTYGAHDFKAYFETPDGAKSNVLHYSILYDDGSSKNPIIGVIPEKDEIDYGETLKIDYNVYTPGQETTDTLNIKLYSLEENGSQRVWASSNLSNVTNQVIYTWTCDSYPSSGIVYAEFSSGSTIEKVQLSITSSGSNVSIEPVTTNLVFAFSPAGKSNNDVGKESYSYKYTDVNNVETDIRCTFENMNWASDGYINTQYGTALRLASDGKMNINLPLFSSSFEDDKGQTVRFHGTPVGIGRTIEITLNMHEVTDKNVPVVSCMSDNHSGIVITPQSAYMLSATGSNILTDSTGFIENEESICACYVKDEMKLRIAFVINAGTEDNKQCLCIYINGECANSFPFDNQENFIQNLPISIGNPACITDIYDIKLYDRALSEDEIKTNFYASQNTIAERLAIYAENDVLDDNGDISYEKCRVKYPCLLCMGELSPYKGAKKKVGWVLTKPDGNGGYTIEFDCCDMVDGKYLGTINVQGTSSQKFVRKNYKVQPVYLKDGVPTKFKYAIKKGGIGESTLCWKADYMSSDHANTFNANIGDEILTIIDPNPAQTTNPKVQNIVNGFRCLFFNQADDNSPVEFFGDGCLNNDKGNNKAFGLESDGDLPEDEAGNIISNYTKAQKIEFTNNTSDLCHFKTDNFRHITDDEEDVYTAFESTYPDQGDLEDAGLTPNWDYWQVAVTFLAQRANFWDADATTVVNKKYNGVTYRTERDYRKAIFRNEFPKHFNLTRSLIYYLFLQFTALVDNRAKNMFMTCYDTTVEHLVDTSGNPLNINDCIDINGNVNADKIDWEKSTFAVWCPTLYDLDSCYSAENNGYLRVPYYADWDYELNGTKQFNGYDSRLWLPFEEVYNETGHIKAMAQDLASRELLTYEKFRKEHITDNTEKMCPTIVNKDMEFKYDTPWTEGYYDYSQSTTNPPFIKTNMYKYLHRGQRIYQKDSYIYNRSHMIYSEYQTTQFIQNNINFRVGASNGVSAANADITLTANLALYLAARYGDGSQNAITNGKILPNTPTTIHAINGVGRSDTIYLYSGTDLTDIGDISIFEPYEIQLKNATKLKVLTIGSKKVRNTSLSSLDTSAMSLLQKINIENCVALSGTFDVSGNGLIQEVYASGAGCTYIKLPDGGNLRKLEVPAVRILSVLNHANLEHFNCDSYDNLNQLRIENTPNIPSDDILMNRMLQLTSGIRLVNVEWNLENSDLLEKLLSDDIKGKYITSAGILSEDINAYPYISGIVHIERINQTLYNKLKTVYPYLTIDYQIFTHTVTFYEDVDQVYNIQEIDDGFPALTPIGTPHKKSDKQWVYTFVNWNTSYIKITRDLDIYANYSKTKQKYSAVFYETSASANPLYQINDVDSGDTISYVGDNPSTSGQVCIGWVDKLGRVYNFNVITLDDDICTIDEAGIPEPIVLYCKYDPIQMPTKPIAQLSAMTFGELKAVSNMIALGGNEEWTVIKNEADNQYVVSNTATGVTITLTMGDEITVLLANDISTVWQIYDFVHDTDAEGNKLGITFGMKNLYGNFTRNMNPSFKHCFDYSLSGTKHQNTNDDYSSDVDVTDAVIHEVTNEEAALGYVSLVVNDRTFLRNIVVTDAGGTETTWHFDYKGYYGGDDVQSMEKPSWYISDFTQNTYKLGKVLYNAVGSNSDMTTLSGKIVSSGFGGMEIDTTDGSIIHYVDTANWYNYSVFFELNAGVVIKIPVANGDTVQINHWSLSRNVGGYERTRMREWIINDFTPLFPLSWLNIITPAAKKTGIGNRRVDTITTYDKFWLFSGKEVGTVGKNDQNYDDGELYPILSNSESRIKRYDNGNAGNWWLRSPIVSISDGSYLFLNVHINGGYNNGWASNSYGIALGFSI